jgi:hypothetical protein
LIDLDFITPDSAIPFVRRHRNCFKKGGDHNDDVRKDFLEIEPFLPHPGGVGRILDIGCGMCGIDVLLMRYYPEAELWLLDEDGDDPRDGWQLMRNEAFSSRAAAVELLTANDVHLHRWVNINTTEHLEADLVISLASWGYHYPLSTYNVSGTCIADLRRSEEPARGTIITAYPKRSRCIWTQKGTS